MSDSRRTLPSAVATQIGSRTSMTSASALPKPDCRYIPTLDGLRACAILLVLAAHFGFSKFVPGGFGVTLFFFISGLLITRLLLAEADAGGGISIARFYARRMLRLYPALVVTVAASYGVYAWVEGHVLWKDVAAALLYVSNYYAEWVHFGSGYPEAFQAYVHVGILWSLAVEEQYYAIFPLLFVLMGCNARRLLPVLIGLAVACLVWRFVLAFGGATSSRLYMGTDTRIDSILYGAILSCLMAGTAANEWVDRLTRPSLLVAASLTLLLCFVLRDTLFRDTLRYSLQGLAFIPLVTALCFSTRLGRISAVLGSPPMRLIGAWSYSIYLTHQLATTIAALLTHEHDAQGFRNLSLQWYAVALGGTMVLTWLSFYLVERPFFALRHRFGSRAAMTGSSN